MDGVKVALGSRGMMVHAGMDNERMIGRSGEP